jgi:hypothetical protein
MTRLLPLPSDGSRQALTLSFLNSLTDELSSEGVGDCGIECVGVHLGPADLLVRDDLTPRSCAVGGQSSVRAVTRAETGI